MEDLRHFVMIGTFTRTHQDGTSFDMKHRLEDTIHTVLSSCLVEPTVYQKLDDTRMDQHGLFWSSVAVGRFW